ncbi:MAG: HAMP domain-containing sensor histidine kinase [Chloroflexota bacterium]
MLTMLRSLRSWLLLSFSGLIFLVLFFILVAAFLIGSLPRIRYLPSFQQLEAVSLTSSSELRRIQRAGGDTEDYFDVLAQASVENNVRVLIVNRNQQILLDSNNNRWQGDSLENSFRFNLGDPEVIAGLYAREKGNEWLVYSRTDTTFGQFLIVYATPEPSRLSYFQDLRLGQLLLTASGITFLIAIFLAFGVAAAIARPLSRMAQAAEAIADGEYEQTIEMRGPSEVQSMANSFNLMSTQVALTRQAQRDFVANVSHDLKTPITSIQGWSQAILDGTAVTPELQQQAARVIHDESERMARMVQELLDLAKIESGQLTLNLTFVDLCQIGDDVTRNLMVKAQEKGVHFTVDKTAVPPIMGDTDRLMQVFTNLVDNAITHTPSGGRVHLDIHPHGDGAVDFIVQDTGKGIPPEDLARIFERFYQVDKSRQNKPKQGTGLGLAIVNELVQLHNGRISAQSEIGKGSIFTVRLPRTNNPQATTIIQTRPS